ncbi:MAG: hypothetical protein QNK05_09655, partial [Myxococcota bacterium]|nr:hypothetical protein [Myxococcota bacterium]
MRASTVRTISSQGVPQRTSISTGALVSPRLATRACRRSCSAWRSPNAQETLVRKLLEEAEHERLQARVASLGETSTPVEIEVRWGTPWLEIVR